MKDNFEIMRQIRGSWTINPKTRVHDNNIRRNKKKQRQEGKNISRNFSNGDS